MWPRKGLGVEKIVSMVSSALVDRLDRLSLDHFFKNVVEAGDGCPVGIVRAQFAQVGHIAHVITLAILVVVDPVDFATGNLLDPLDRLENGDAVAAAPAQVLDLAGPRVGRKLLHGVDYVVAVDVIAYLLAFVAANVVGAALDRYLQQIGEESV